MESLPDYQIINAIFQKPIDINLLKSYLDKNIVIYDLYGSKDGFASIVMDALNELGYKKNIKALCVPHEFIAQGSTKEQRSKLHLTIEDLKTLLK